MRTRKPSAAEAGDGALAWAALGRTGEYRAAWERHGAVALARAHEPGPFRIRVQAAADIDAARFELLAWEDPREADGPALPFWRQRGMPEGSLEPGVEPLAAMAGGGASVDGLRLLGGELVVRVRSAGAAVQVLLRGVERFPDDGGIVLRIPFGLRMPQAVRRLNDFWNVAGRGAPREGRARAAGFGRPAGC